ncbi:MAG TPA: DsbA family oxidoreductase [Kofleriaceae bacterium]|nr:DsbA family oxidoreductase [Kofleriaceae bacterium]
MAKLRVDIWSDVVCPWCYIGKRRLEAALARSPHAASVELVWRSFELDPGAPRELPDVDNVARLARKYRIPVAQAQQMVDRVTGVAAGERLELHLDRARGGNTFDAHRLIQLARALGRQTEVKERLMRAYFTEGQPIGDREALRAIAISAGLAEAEVDDVLGGERYAAEVRADESLARELGITAVPFFVIGGKLGVSGAQPADVLVAALARGWSDHGEAAALEGEACGPDGCA